MSNWQPFDSAPTDGREILAWRWDAGVFMAHHRDSEPDGDLCWFTTAGEDLTGDPPTHWMPLPAQPDGPPGRTPPRRESR